MVTVGSLDVIPDVVGKLRPVSSNFSSNGIFDLCNRSEAGNMGRHARCEGIESSDERLTQRRNRRINFFCRHDFALHSRDFEINLARLRL